MRLKRNIETKTLKLLEYFPIVAIIGVRQCGKTSLARWLKPKWRYVDLENSSNFELIDNDPGLFLKQNPKDVIFDEAQLYPQLFSELRHQVDEQRELKGRYIITGSSSPELLKNISETLAGRVAIIQLGTLKMNEFLNKDLSKLYEVFSCKSINEEKILSLSTIASHKQVLNHWVLGGFPEPRIKNDKLFFNLWSEQYINQYIYRDIKRLFPKINEIRYRKLINILASQTSQILNQSTIARTLEVSSPTTKDYTDIAQLTYIWRNLTSFEKNVTKATIKMPKGYITDTGLIHSLLKLQDLETLQNNPIMGSTFEAFIVEEIIKGLQATMLTNWSAHHYRTRAKSELDCIIDSPNGVIPIEVKYASTIKPKSLNTIKNFIKDHNSPFGLLVNNSDKVEKISDKLYQIPVRCI